MQKCSCFAQVSSLSAIERSQLTCRSCLLDHSLGVAINSATFAIVCGRRLTIALPDEGGYDIYNESYRPYNQYHIYKMKVIRGCWIDRLCLQGSKFVCNNKVHSSVYLVSGWIVCYVGCMNGGKFITLCWNNQMVKFFRSFYDL